jgi:hypothetical protein
MPLYPDPSSIYPSTHLYPGQSTVTALGEGTVTNVIRYLGEASTPRNIRRHRANQLDTMRRFGSPVLIKKMYTDADVVYLDDGSVSPDSPVIPSPSMNSVYDQPRHQDPLSHGQGFVSKEVHPSEWYDTTTGTIIVSEEDPGRDYLPAPKYRGYGPGYLTYVLLPDTAQDVFKLNEAGVLIRTQQAQVQMGWVPNVSDNDLMVIVRIDEAENIVESYERYLAKMTNPVSIRGLDRRGRRETSEDFGNRHIIDQQFEQTLIPANEVLQNIEIDR